MRRHGVRVVGGLYGNVPALRRILEMQHAEARAGTAVSLVFNGDYNWFNAHPAAFREINEVALANVAIQGNVEAEVAQPTDAGCGSYFRIFRLTARAAPTSSLRSGKGLSATWRA